MEITQDLLLKGKPTIIKGKEYLPTSDYVSPFFDEMSKFTDKFIIKVQTPNQITLTDGDEDMTYNRVWIQAVMPEKYCIDNHDEVYSLLYGLDVRTPIYKLYRGTINKACTNLCVFSPDWLDVQPIEEGNTFKYSIKNMMQKTSDIQVRLQKMKNTFLDRDPDSVHKLLGEQIERVMHLEWANASGKVKLSTAMCVKAFQMVYMDSRSPYFVKDTEECSVFNYYNAFTQLVTDDDRDIIGKFEKTLLIDSLFNLID